MVYFHQVHFRQGLPAEYRTASAGQPSAARSPAVFGSSSAKPWRSIQAIAAEAPITGDRKAKAPPSSIDETDDEPASATEPAPRKPPVVARPNAPVTAPGTAPAQPPDNQ